MPGLKTIKFRGAARWILVAGAWVLLSAACQRPARDATAPEGGVTTSPVKMADETKVKPDTVGDYTLGKPECDDFLRNYEQCLNNRVPPDKKTELRAAFEKTVEQLHKWRTENPENLVGFCKQASDLTLTTMRPFGCSW